MHEEGARHLSMATNEDSTERAPDMFLLDRGVTIDTMTNCQQIYHGSAYEIKNRLGFHNVCARWVPKQQCCINKHTWTSPTTYGSTVVTNGMPSETESSQVTKRGSIIASGEHMAEYGMETSTIVHLCRKTDAHGFLGLTRPSNGTLSGRGHNNKQCSLQ
jgi:hypothetical protein